LDLARRTAGELRTLLETRQSELKTLKEQVEADDRVETLERSLQATQDRTEELEFQLSKVKQVCYFWSL
jgi:chromosome segregation ATPase